MTDFARVNQNPIQQHQPQAEVEVQRWLQDTDFEVDAFTQMFLLRFPNQNPLDFSLCNPWYALPSPISSDHLQVARYILDNCDDEDDYGKGTGYVIQTFLDSVTDDESFQIALSHHATPLCHARMNGYFNRAVDIVSKKCIETHQQFVNEAAMNVGLNNLNLHQIQHIDRARATLSSHIRRPS